MTRADREALIAALHGAITADLGFDGEVTMLSLSAEPWV